MKLVTFSHAGRVSPGLWLDGDRVLDLHATGGMPDSLLDIIAAPGAVERLRRLQEQPGEATLSAGDVRLMAPIPRPRKNVFCAGRNYLDHVAEGYRARSAELKVPEYPQFFTKPPTAVIGPYDDIRLDAKVTEKLDYEVELALIIGPGGRDIPPGRAFDHVFGYTVLNDVTARDLQRRHDQWFKGKGLDTSCPMGPCIVHRSAVADPRRLELSLTVNGEERQRATVAQMIFDIPRIIADLSAGMTLEPGDIIATGTPSGVGYAMQPPRLLQPGDLVVSRIDGIGRMENRVVAA